jgi:hypothetical protein
MLKYLFLFLNRLLGRNLIATPIETIRAQLDEVRPLPIGRDQFLKWSDRIISGAMVEADSDSQRFALASMVLQLGPTEAFKSDRHFVASLRKVATNQTCHTMAQEFKLAATARFEREKAELAAANMGPPVNTLVNAVPDVTANGPSLTAVSKK